MSLLKGVSLHSLNSTPKSINYVHQILLLEYIFQSYVCQNYVRFRVQNYMFLLRWAILLTVEIDGANLQLQYVQMCVNMCFGNLVTTSSRQRLRLKLFLNICNVIIYVASVILS